MRAVRLCIAALAVSAGFVGLAGAQAADSIVREGEGPRRAALTKLELKPFDFGAFAGLSDWKNGGAISQGVADGKPVLIVTWTDYVPASKRALTLARRLAEKHGANGLIVVAAHAPAEWASAAKPEAPKDSVFLLAHDKDGAFRKSIQSDADPDFYVIDRAGQLRFADVDTASVEAACEAVVKESKADAGGINATLKAAADARTAEQRRTDAARAAVDLTNLPEVPFEEPDAEAYKAAHWPYPPRDPNAAQNRQPGDPEPDPFADLPKFSPPESSWFPEKPTEKGRMTLLYFWHPDARLTFGKQMDAMQLLQKQHKRDLIVVGVLSPIVDSGGQRKLDMDPEKLKSKMEEFRASREITHYFTADPDGSLFELSKKFYSETNGLPIPWGMLVGSDGTIHWWGHLDGPRGRAAFDKMLVTDPGVLARRKAEEAFIKSKQ